MTFSLLEKILLNQVHVCFWPVCDWFLEIGFVGNVCMHVLRVCVSPPGVIITIGAIGSDIEPL